MDYANFVERARTRARDERHQARWRDGHLTVVSDSTPGESYEQMFEITPQGALWFHCTCISGKHRCHLLVPCKHATRWGDRMAREISGMVKLVDGVYWTDDADMDTDAAVAFASREMLRRIQNEVSE